MMKYRRNIPYVGEEEVEAAAEVIRSGMLVRGQVVKDFEKMFAEKHNKKYCVMTSSCTAALQLALEIIAIENDIESVLIPDYTFFATGNAVFNVGLKPEIVDVDLHTYNIDMKKTGVEKDDMIMPVHVFGNPCKKDDFKDFNVPIIEDAATAIGSKGIGFGDIQCFSFHGAKIMTTGIGGCLTTDEKDWAELAETLARAGRPDWKEPAYNYQISNINAAIGIEQLKKLDFIIKTRRKFAKRYNDLFETSEEYISPQKTKGSNYQSYVVRIPSNTRDKVMRNLRAQSIEACVGYYSMTDYYFEGYAPVGNALDRQQLCLPLYVQMTEQDQDFIVEQTIKAVRKFC